jgi:DNA polymerase III delta prime subunit
MEFCKKYNPKSLSDVIGNKQQINAIKNWLLYFSKNKYNGKKSKTELKIKSNSNPNILIESDSIENVNIIYSRSTKKLDNNYSCLLIIGDHGVGKTCSIISLLNELQYTYYQVVLSKIKSGKNVLDSVNKLLKNRNIIDKTNNNTSKFAIIIDDVESINSPIEKNFIMTLLKQNDENWFCPIIFISSGKHSKIITTLKKNSNIIYFNKPTKDNLMKMLICVYQNENMFFENDDVANKIIDRSQNDFRKLLSFLQDLKSTFGKTKISSSSLETFSKTTKTKDIDVEIFKATTELLTNYKNINECFRLYESEKVILPLMIHQNYIKYINNNKNSLKLINDISSSLSFGDLIENYVFSEQNWDMYEAHGFLSCVNPSFKLLNLKTYGFNFKLDFPSDFNKTSIKRINKKNITNSATCFKNLDINDFMLASKLTKNLLTNLQFEQCTDLYAGYGTKIENIESLLKIDKTIDIDPTTNTKNVQLTNKLLTPQTKKKLLELMK